MVFKVNLGYTASSKSAWLYETLVNNKAPKQTKKPYKQTITKNEDLGEMVAQCLKTFAARAGEKVQR